MSDYDDLVAALSPVSAALTSIGIRHYVGGSVASSFHGASRSTMDVDLVADMSDSAESVGVQELLERIVLEVNVPNSGRLRPEST